MSPMHQPNRLISTSGILKSLHSPHCCISHYSTISSRSGITTYPIITNANSFTQIASPPLGFSTASKFHTLLRGRRLHGASSCAITTTTPPQYQHFHTNLSNQWMAQNSKNTRKTSLEEKLAKDFKSGSFSAHREEQFGSKEESKKQGRNASADDEDAAPWFSSGKSTSPTRKFLADQNKVFKWNLHKDVPPPVLMFFSLVTLPPAIALGILPLFSLASVYTYTSFFMNYSAVLLASSAAVDVGLIVGPHLEPYKSNPRRQIEAQRLMLGAGHRPMALEGGESPLLLEGRAEGSQKDYQKSADRLHRMKNRLSTKTFQPDILGLEATRRFDWHRAFIAAAIVMSSALSLQLNVFAAAVVLISSSAANILFAFLTTHSTDLPKWYGPMKLLQGGFLLAFLFGVIFLHILSVTTKAFEEQAEKSEEELKTLEKQELFPRLQRPEIKVPLEKRDRDPRDLQIEEMKKKIRRAEMERLD